MSPFAYVFVDREWDSLKEVCSAQPSISQLQGLPIRTLKFTNYIEFVDFQNLKLVNSEMLGRVPGQSDTLHVPSNFPP